MDSFMENITHKVSATDIIKANGQADAMELESKRETILMFESQMKRVDSVLSDMKEVNDLSIEGINRTVDESLQKIEQIKEASDQSEIITSGMDSLSEKLAIMKKELEEYLHADHVRIYRNVQAAFNEELTRQLDEVKKVARKRGPVLPLVIVTMVSSLAGTALMVLHILGII